MLNNYGSIGIFEEKKWNRKKHKQYKKKWKLSTFK